MTDVEILILVIVGTAGLLLSLGLVVASIIRKSELDKFDVICRAYRDYDMEVDHGEQ